MSILLPVVCCHSNHYTLPLVLPTRRCLCAQKVMGLIVDLIYGMCYGYCDIAKLSECLLSLQKA